MLREPGEDALSILLHPRLPETFYLRERGTRIRPAAGRFRCGWEGGYTARALGESIFTEADTENEFQANIIDAPSLSL